MEFQRLITALSNGPFRIIFSFGLALLLTPKPAFSQGYAALFALADKDVWGMLFVLLGLLGFTSLYIGLSGLYRFTIALCGSLFAILSVIFASGGNSPGAVTTYGNLGLNCLLILAGLPIYGYANTSKDCKP